MSGIYRQVMAKMDKSTTALHHMLKPDRGQDAVALHLTDKNGFETWLSSQPEQTRQAVRAQGFKGEASQLTILPGENSTWSVLLGVADVQSLGPWCLARAAEKLPEGQYRLVDHSPGPSALGWLLAQYSFDRYKTEPRKKQTRILLSDEVASIDHMIELAVATNLVRNLVNTPAGGMGPAELEAAAREVAEQCGATVTVTSGTELEKEYPLVAAVGGAAIPERAPRMIELAWGQRIHPRIALVGKGVCFDSGGLDIKNSAGMRLMKKDMGGAAHALALALLIMKKRLPVQLHLLIPAVENAISGAAFRPGDVLHSRNGLTVEIGNTDAEGRLILADALTRAVEDKPDLVIDFATLTGAARIALGPDLPALFANDDGLADSLRDAGKAVSDPIWEMPLWSGYEDMLASDVADISNSAEGAMAGAIVAALFLRKFIPDGIPWAHLDTYAWRTSAKPGRPKGGDALGLRAAWHMLSNRYAATRG